MAHHFDPFVEQVAALGYVLGRSITLEFRFAEDQLDRLPALAAELINYTVAVIVAVGMDAAQAAATVSGTTPIVVIGGGDVVAAGLADSIARPGRNVTGLIPQIPFFERYLALLQEAVPSVSHLGFLSVGGWPTDDHPGWQRWHRSAREVGIQLQRVVVAGADDIEPALAAGAAAGMTALFVGLSHFSYRHRVRLLAAAQEQRLATITTDGSLVHAGALLSYGFDLAGKYRLAPAFVDKILTGTRPAEIPSEQLNRFDLVINLRTARALALTLPPSVLAQATAALP
jgi:putative ABC transport system substrate-binding protein